MRYFQNNGKTYGYDTATQQNLINDAIANGWIEVTGSWPPPPSPPSPAQLAQQAMNAGVVCAFVNYPSLDATYSCNLTSQQLITSTTLYTQVNGKFPGTSGQLSWADMSGNVHVFSNTAVFGSFASNIADYVYDLNEIIINNSGILPSNQITID